MTEKMTNEELAAELGKDALYAELDEDRCPDGMAYRLDEAARRLRAMSWRPISEAPKDGTSVLVVSGYVPEESVCEAMWRTYSKPGWVWVGDRDAPDPYMEPTHFMPLPQPPEPTE